MKRENNIDNYFDRVKQNPPLMDLEKVCHLIANIEAETEAKAETKVKKGHRNFLKFTIMTTIFAVIISAVLFWPGESLESSIRTQDTSSRTQDTRHKTQDTRHKTQDIRQLDGSASGFQVGSETHEPGSIETGFSGNEATAKNTPKQESSLLTPNHSIIFPLDQNYQKKIAETNLSPDGSDEFDPNSIQPSDGARFILKLSDEELIKIGFEVSDSSYEYKQQVDTLMFRYYFYINRVADFKIDADGNKTILEDEPKITTGHTEFEFTSYSTTKLTADQFDFFPVFKSNLFYSEISDNQKLKKENFHMANDTLLAVVLPVSNLISTVQDKLIWFTTSEKFYAALSPKHKGTIEEFKKFKAAKKAFSTKDLVIYQPPKLFDESKVVMLTKDELGKLGFRFYSDSTIYKGNSSEIEIEYFKSFSTSRATYSKGLSLEQYSNLLAVMVTRTDGSPYANLDHSSILIKMDDKEYGKQFPLLIPVLLKSGETVFEEDVLFWFYPSDQFFDALPGHIGNELRKEYNYVIAENKSMLVQPECKYFEECKNTLDISNFKVYPNPAKNQATVSFSLPEAIGGRIILVDLSGRERQVLQPDIYFPAGSHRFDFDLSTVVEGIYLITLYSNKGVQTQRLMVVR